MSRLARLWLPAALGVAITAGVASASMVVSQGSDTVGGPESLQPSGSPATIGVVTPDPDGGPDWAVRVYVSKTGNVCPEAGRVLDGRFGRVDAKQNFAALPVEASGSCGDLNQTLAAFAVNRYPANQANTGRSVIFGAVSRDVRSVTLIEGDTPEEVAIGHDTFLVVKRGAMPRGLRLRFESENGQTTSYELR